MFIRLLLVAFYDVDTPLGFESVVREIRKLRRTVWIVLVFLIICTGTFVAAVLITPETTAAKLDEWTAIYNELFK